MTRICSILLVLTILAACSPVSAQDLVSPKLLPPPAELRVQTVPNFNAAFDTPRAASDQPSAKQKHWTKGGKIMTFVGLGLAGAGAGALGYGLSHNNNNYCSPGSTCVSVAWKWTGAAWLGAGAALTIVGLTRRSAD